LEVIEIADFIGFSNVENSHERSRFDRHPDQEKPAVSSRVQSIGDLIDSTGNQRLIAHVHIPEEPFHAIVRVEHFKDVVAPRVKFAFKFGVL